MIPEVEKILGRITAIHEKKNQDYAQRGKPFENFERSSEMISWFNKPTDQAFVALIATKMARLATLKNQGGTPQNESIEDSLLDLSVYCILWYAHYLNTNEPLQFQVGEFQPCCFTCLKPIPFDSPRLMDYMGRAYCREHASLAKANG